MSLSVVFFSGYKQKRGGQHRESPGEEGGVWWSLLADPASFRASRDVGLVVCMCDIRTPPSRPAARA